MDTSNATKSLLYVENSSGAVFDITGDGVVNIASSKMKIGGSAGTDGYVLTTDGAGGIAWEASPGAGSVDGSGTASYIPKWTDSDTIGNSALFDGGGNNVGIGTNNPQGQFQLHSTASAVQRLVLSNTNANLNPQQRIEFWESAATSTSTNAHAAIEYVGDGTYESSDGTLLIKGYGSSADLPIAGFNRNGNVYLGMSGTKRVGINTLTPVKDIDLKYSSNNSADLAGSGLAGGAAGNGILINNTATNVSSYANLDFRANNADGRIAYRYDAANQGSFHFITDNDSAGFVNAMSIMADGNVGIGTDDPAYTLDVYETGSNIAIFRSTATNWARVIIRAGASGDAQLSFQESTNTKWTIGNDGGDSDKFKIVVGGGAFGTSPIVAIDTAGKVGVGSNAPAFNLDVTGTGHYTGLLNLNAGLYLSRESNTSYGTYIKGGSHQLPASPDAYYALGKYVMSAVAYAYDTLTGHVVVGYGNPNTNNSFAKINFTVYFRQNNSLATGAPYVTWTYNVEGKFTFQSDPPFRVSKTQDVSDGAKTYELQFSVGAAYGTAQWKVCYTNVNTNANTVTIYDTVATIGTAISDGRVTRQGYQIYPGCVGIGTTSPANTFHLAADAPRIRLEDTLGTSNYSMITADNGQLTLSADDGNDQASSAQIFQVDGGEVMRMTGASVGIGTNGPETKLHVEGSDYVGSSIKMERTSAAGTNEDAGLIFNTSSARTDGQRIGGIYFGQAGTSWGMIRGEMDGTTGGKIYFIAGSQTNQISNTATKTFEITSAFITSAVDIRPTVDSSYDLGASTLKWAELYVDKIKDASNSTGSANQVLSAGGSGGSLDWVSLSDISGVDGSGTANYVTKWTDGDTVGNSILRDDGTRLAVGAAPSAGGGILHLKDTTSNQAKITLESADAYNSWINFSAASNEMSLGYDKATVGGLVFANSDTLASNIRMVILSSGNVGINTTSPATELHAHGTTLTGRTTGTTGAYVLNSYDLVLSNGNGGTVILLYNNTGAYHSGLIKYDTNCLKLGLNNSNSTNAILTTTAVNVGSVGVGIGTDDPGSKLEVYAASGLVASHVKSGTVISRLTANSTASDGVVGTSSAHDFLIQRGGSTKITVAAASTKFADSVGIDVVPNAANKLEVNGQLRATTGMFGNSSVSNVAAKPIHIKYGGTAELRLEDSTSSNYVYDISADFTNGFRITDVTSTLVPFTISKTTGVISITSTDAAAQLTITPTGTNANARINIVPPGTGRAIFQYGGTEKISFDATTTVLSNNVGIGTNVPAERLHVYIAGNDIPLRVQTDNHVGVEIKGGASHDIYFLLADTATNAKIGWDHSATALKFNASANFTDNHLVVKSTGVGIGTDNPSNRLHVEGDTLATASIRIEKTTTGINEDPGLVLAAANNTDGYRIGSIFFQGGATSYAQIRAEMNGTAGAKIYFVAGSQTNPVSNSSAKTLEIEDGIITAATAIRPLTDSSYTLGQASLKWSELYVDKIKDVNNSTGSANQILSAGGSGGSLDWVSLSEITGVDGSGTANTIPRWTDSDTIGNSIITVPSNNRVEITGNHTSPFEAIGQSAAGISYSQFVNSSTSAVGNGVGLELRALTSTQERQLSFITSRWLDNTDASRKSRLIITTNDGGTLYNTYQAYGKDPILAADAGNVGIGTTNPAEILEVVSDSDPTILIRPVTVDSANSGKISYRENAGGTTGVDLRYDGANNRFSIDTSDVANAFVVKRTDGNVGIGTNAPAKKLEVNFTGDDGVQIQNTGSSHASIWLDGGTGGVGAAYLRMTSRDGTNTMTHWINLQSNGNLVFRPAATGTAANQIIFNQNGSIGIGGTPTSGNKLFVNGNSFLDGTAYVDDALTVDGYINFDTMGDYLTFYGNANAHHSISSRNSSGTADDDIRINTYGGLFINLDSNGNDSSESHSSFQIGRHAGTGAVSASDLFLNLSGETGKLRLYKYGSGTHTGTAAYKLSVDSSGNVIETAVGAGAVDGSGTANKVTKWTDTDTIGDSQITDNGTSVGINQGSPNAANKLEVSGTVTCSHQLISAQGYTQPPVGMLTLQGPTNGGTTINSDVWGLVIGPQHTRSSTANTYYAGIAFNHLLNHSGGATYNNAPQAWIGTRLHDTSGSERGFLVFATKSGTGTAASDVPVERMCIDPAAGHVGIGTTDPAYILDVYETGSNLGIFRSTATNYARLVVRSGSAGDAQLAFQNSTSTKWSIGNDGGDSDKFKIAVGSGAFSTSEAVTISTSGCVGIGTNAPLEPLHVYDGGDWQIRMSSGGSRAGLVIDKPGTTSTMGSALVLSSDETYRLGTASYYHVVMQQAGGTLLQYQGNTKLTTTSGGVTVTGTLTETSSITLKENVETYTPSLDIINKIRPVKYNRKTNKDKKEIGLIAEELAELFPELVEKDEEGNPSSVNYSRAVTVLLGGFKELYKEIEELKKRI